MSDQNKWEFHFRNFENKTVDFATHHFGCGGAPWHDGRARCNHLKVPYNPTGGHNSVYVPSSFIVKENQWVTLILQSIKTVTDIGLSVATDGENLNTVLQDVLKVASDTVEAVAHDIGADLDALSKDAASSFAASCQAVNKTPDQVTAIAEEMGLSPNSFGFIAGDAYKKYIHDDNSETNDSNGWSIFADDGTRRIANAAFMDQGHLIFYFNPNDLDGFWNKHW